MSTQKQRAQTANYPANHSRQLLLLFKYECDSNAGLDSSYERRGDFFCERRARAPSFTRTVRRTSLNKNKLHPSREPRARNPHSKHLLQHAELALDDPISATLTNEAAFWTSTATSHRNPTDTLPLATAFCVVVGFRVIAALRLNCGPCLDCGARLRCSTARPVSTAGPVSLRYIMDFLAQSNQETPNYCDRKD